MSAENSKMLVFFYVGEAEGQLLISAKRRFPKPTNPCRNLKIFMEENTLKKIVMAAPSVALFPKH